MSAPVELIEGYSKDRRPLGRLDLAGLRLRKKEARKTPAHSRSEVPTGVSLYPASVNSWHTEFATTIQLHRLAVVERLKLRLRRHLSNDATNLKDNIKPLCLCRCHRRRGRRRRSPVLVRLRVV